MKNSNVYNKIFALKVFFALAILANFISILIGSYLIVPFIANLKIDISSNIQQLVTKHEYKLYYKENALVAKQAKDINSGKKTQKDKAQAIPVLIYHGIVDKPDGSNITVENFKHQMFALKMAGYKTITLKDFHEFLNRKKQLPAKSFLLTFDDGRRDSYYPVDPILQALNYSAVMFIIGNTIDKSSFHLNSFEIKRLIDSGRWEIQSHAFNAHGFYLINANGKKGHYLSNKLWDKEEHKIESDLEYQQRIGNELKKAKIFLQDKFNVDIISFAYPFGDFGQNSINFHKANDFVISASKKIYKMAFYQVNRNSEFTSNYNMDKSFLIKRIAVEPDWTENDLLKVLEESQPKLLPFYDDFSFNRGWIANYGQISVSGGCLALMSNNIVKGACAFLDGSYLWNNYYLKANIICKKGIFSVLTFFKDSKNYIAIRIDNHLVRIDQIKNGKVIASTTFKNAIQPKNCEALIEIKTANNYIECFLNKRLIARGSVDSSFRNGGIGFESWAGQDNRSLLLIKELKVEDIDRLKQTFIKK